ncbi:MAG: ATP-dependent helicase [Flavobacteriaceae bacterium]|nr:MAG: ATP-dependent helicase [Flavobacteriaceae bacterium]
MQEVSYKIYNASAGSGKTYTLVKEYLKIVLASKNNWAYQYILAITFTNKAVNEMKYRILDSLFEFSKITDFDNSPPLFNDLFHDLKITPADLQKKSKKVLKEILHNYAFFDISTIDKFTHRLIRTFAKDLKLPQNFEVVMDTDLLLGEAVDKLISKAGTDKELTQVLIDFTLEKIDDDKSWDVSFDLNKIGKLLFDETHAGQLDKLKDKSIVDFMRLRKTIKLRIKKIQQVCMAHAKATLQLIGENNLEIEDFTRKTLPNHFIKITEQIFEPNKLYNNKLEENLIDGNIYNKTLDAGKKSIIDLLLPQLLQTYLQIKKENAEWALLKNAYNNIVPLTVLNAINKEIKEIEEEKNQIHISAFNTIISKEIKNQPAPFIYERLGEKYRHYFIDEFQDTSQMQWENLIPLISNALEGENLKGEKGSLFLVGDAKQAIYRWRGGKAEQFLNLISLNNNPFVVTPHTQNLPTNYRSHSEIITFNNEFFTHTSSFLNNPAFSTLFYEGNKQETTTKKNGYVQLTFIKNENGENEDVVYCEEILHTIHTIIGKKYAHKDICILVRENRKGILLADYLIQNNVPIISTDSLLLISSGQVGFLITLLKYCLNPENIDNAYSLLYYLALENNDQHRFIHQYLENIDVLLEQSYNFNLEHLKQMSVYDGLEYAIKQFSLIDGSNAHITYLLDIVLEVEQREGTGIHTFLSYWEKKGEKLSVPAPENSNAVQIMSIHKSKGLEFPFVIYPFANSHIYKEKDKKLWVPLQKEPLDGFHDLLLNKKQEMENYNPISKKLYLEEQSKLELDAFNVLYVVLTRAVKGLFIITKNDLTPKGAHKMAYYSGLFIDYLKQKEIWQTDLCNYSFGLLEDARGSQKSESEEQCILYQYSNKERPSFSILTTSGVLWETERELAISKGNIIHHIMSLIKTSADVEKAIMVLMRNGDVTENDKATLKNKVHQIIRHPLLCQYYSGGIDVKNECDIITDQGEILRPDRVVIINNKATIIDYKTGKKNPVYKQQLHNYADALRMMGYDIEDKIIVYINDVILPEFF